MSSLLNMSLADVAAQDRKANASKQNKSPQSQKKTNPTKKQKQKKKDPLNIQVKAVRRKSEGKGSKKGAEGVILVAKNKNAKKQVGKSSNSKQIPHQRSSNKAQQGKSDKPKGQLYSSKMKTDRVKLMNINRALEVADLKVKVVTDDEGNPSGVAVITFKTCDDAVKFRDNYNGVLLDQRPMKIELMPKSRPQMLTSRVGLISKKKK